MIEPIKKDDTRGFLDTNFANQVRDAVNQALTLRLEPADYGKFDIGTDSITLDLSGLLTNLNQLKTSIDLASTEVSITRQEIEIVREEVRQAMEELNLVEAELSDIDTRIDELSLGDC